MEGGLSGVRICEGFTGHERLTPATNGFRYPVVYIRFDTRIASRVDSILRTALRFFSFRPQEYLFRKSADLDGEIRSFLKNEMGFEAEEIELVTIPRLFGYAFNPVSFWICRNDRKMDAVLCEVNNTFGERHFYWLRVRSPDEWIRMDKAFHVSPFLPLDGSYRFRFQDDGQRTRIDINYHSESGRRVLSTWLDLRNRPVEGVSGPSLLFKYGWITVCVILRIHFQAVRLFLKRVRFFSKPQPPTNEVSR